METIEPRLLEILACPKCKRKLSYPEAGKFLVCEGCRLQFSIARGVPILMIERAQPLEF